MRHEVKNFVSSVAFQAFFEVRICTPDEQKGSGAIDMAKGSTLLSDPPTETDSQTNKASQLSPLNCSITVKNSQRKTINREISIK